MSEAAVSVMAVNELHDPAPEASAPAPAPASAPAPGPASDATSDATSDAASDPARIEAEPAPASPFTVLGGGTAFGSCDIDGNCD